MPVYVFEILLLSHVVEMLEYIFCLPSTYNKLYIDKFMPIGICLFRVLFLILVRNMFVYEQNTIWNT
jgi:hypothetical protein